MTTNEPATPPPAPESGPQLPKAFQKKKNLSPSVLWIVIRRALLLSPFLLIIAVIVSVRLDPTARFFASQKVLELERDFKSDFTLTKKVLGITMRYDASQMIDAARRGDMQALSILLNAGMDPNVADDQGRSPIQIAAEMGFPGPVQLLAGHGADLNKASGGDAPLYTVVKQNGTIMAQQLLGMGADPNARSKDGDNALLAAIELQNPDIIEALFTARANVNLANAKGVTPIMKTIEVGNVDLLKKLLAKGVNVNTSDSLGRTPLMYAIAKGNATFVSALLEAGADPYMKDQNGQSAADLAFMASKPIQEFFKKPSLDHYTKTAAGSSNPPPPSSSGSSSSRGAYSQLTGLRVTQRPTAIWSVSPLTLTKVEMKVRNVGSFKANDVSVSAKAPNGHVVKLAGPNTLDSNEVGTYVGSCNEAVRAIHDPVPVLKCSNCH